MNNNFEKNNLKKDKRRRNSNKPRVKKLVDYKIVEPTERRFKDGGFIAWPQTELPLKKDEPQIEVIEGRSKKGGFIAFPKTG